MQPSFAHKKEYKPVNAIAIPTTLQHHKINQINEAKNIFVL